MTFTHPSPPGWLYSETLAFGLARCGGDRSQRNMLIHHSCTLQRTVELTQTPCYLHFVLVCSRARASNARVTRWSRNPPLFFCSVGVSFIIVVGCYEHVRLHLVRTPAATGERSSRAVDRCNTRWRTQRVACRQLVLLTSERYKSTD